MLLIILYYYLKRFNFHDEYTYQILVGQLIKRPRQQFWSTGHHLLPRQRNIRFFSYIQFFFCKSSTRFRCSLVCVMLYYAKLNKNELPTFRCIEVKTGERWINRTSLDNVSNTHFTDYHICLAVCFNDLTQFPIISNSIRHWQADELREIYHFRIFPSIFPPALFEILYDYISTCARGSLWYFFSTAAKNTLHQRSRAVYRLAIFVS